VSVKGNLISFACLPYRMCAKNRIGLWSLAVSLRLDYRNENEYHTKD
jgi:hypothetical protein